jgi:hypothetical protein
MNAKARSRAGRDLRIRREAQARWLGGLTRRRCLKPRFRRSRRCGTVPSAPRGGRPGRSTQARQDRTLVLRPRQCPRQERPLLTCGRRSSTHTSRLSPASLQARAKPAKPAPTIATSTRSGPSIELSFEPYVAARHRTMSGLARTRPCGRRRAPRLASRRSSFRNSRHDRRLTLALAWMAWSAPQRCECSLRTRWSS